ncbi:GNAT family N-acetyltransferase [Kordiimonas sp.]
MRDILKHFSKDQTLKTIWLDVYEENARARHVYASLGFRETGTDTAKVPGRTLILMEIDNT